MRALIRRALRPLAHLWAPLRVDLPPETWRLARDELGVLRLDGVDLGDLLDRWGSPVHVVDAARLTDNASRFVARPPRAAAACEVYASYKTNPVPRVLGALHQLDIGAEVVSAYELWLALRLGVSPASIVYNGPAKSDASVGEALRREIGLINVNSRGEIAALAAAARRLGKRPRVGVRVVVPGTWGGQFGERIDTGAALAAFREVLAAPELRVVALHAHPNSEISSSVQLDNLLSGLLAFADELRQSLGLELEILDLGGNLACPTVSGLGARARRLALTFGCEPAPRPPGTVLGIDEYVRRVRERIERHYNDIGRSTPRVFLEPGRSLTGNTQSLLCRVMQVSDPHSDGLTWAVLDAGINVAEPLRNEWHQLFSLAPRPRAPRRLYRLTGPSCNQGDILYPAWALPEIAAGDGLAIMDSGAYFVPFSTDFSFPRPPVVMLEGGRDVVLRRAESFEDLVALDDLASSAGREAEGRRPPFSESTG